MTSSNRSDFRTRWFEACTAHRAESDSEWFGRLDAAVDSAVAPAAAAADRMATPSRQSLAALADIGALGVQIPRRLGGLGFDDRAACLVVERVAQACAATAAVLMFHFQVVRRTLAVGDESYRDDDLRGFASGLLIGCSAWTEENAGPRKHDVHTTLTERADGGLEIDGVKTFCTGATVAHRVHILADLRETRHAGATFVRVDTKEPGVTVSEPYPLLGLRGAGTASMRLDGVSVRRVDLVGPPGSGAKLLGHNHEVCLNPGLLALGIATAAFHAALRMLRDAAPARLMNDVVRDSVVTSLVQLESAYSLAADAVAVPATVAARIASAKLKLHCTTVAEDVTARLLHAVGSRGFLGTSPLERQFRDARATALMGPSTDLLRTRIIDDITASANPEETCAQI